MIRRIAILAAVGGLFLMIAGFTILQSTWFSEKLEHRITQEISRATGASVNIGKLNINWRTLRFRASPITLHGTEPAGAQPLLQASEVEIGLSFRSFLKRSVDIRLLRIVSPQIHLLIDKDGSTNIPGGGGGLTAPETLINLAADRLEIVKGMALINEKQIPLNIDANGVEASLLFDPQGPLYRGSLNIQQLQQENIAAHFESEFTLSTNRAQISRLKISTQSSSAEGTGMFEDWNAIRGQLNLNLQASLPEVAQWTGISSLRSGEATGTLTGTLEPGHPWKWQGKVQGKNITASIADETISDIRARASVEYQDDRLSLQNLRAELMEGTFEGQVLIRKPNHFRIEGSLTQVRTPDPLSALVTGPIEVEGCGEEAEKVHGKLTLTPRPGKIPVGGFVSATYDVAANQLFFEPSFVHLGESEIRIAGSLQNHLQVELKTRDLQDLLPATRLIKPDLHLNPDISLEKGWTQIQATVSGTVKNPIVRGTAQMDHLKAMGEVMEKIRTKFELDDSHLNLHDLTLQQRGAALSGHFEVGLQNWETIDTSPLLGTAKFSGATLESFLTQAGHGGSSSLPVTGTASGEAKISGTVRTPAAQGTVRVTQARILQEALDQVTASFSGTPEQVTLTNIVAARGKSALEGSGTWVPGKINFDLSTSNWDFANHLPRQLSASAAGTLKGRLKEQDGDWAFEFLDGTLKTTIRDQGEFTLRATTKEDQLYLDTRGTLQGAQISGRSSWKLAGKMPGSGSFQIGEISPAFFQNFFPTEDSLTEFPFNGRLAGSATFQGNLLEPDLLTGRAIFPRVELIPRQESFGEGITATDLTLRNDGDVILVANQRGVLVERARFRAKDTQIEASGTLSFRRENTWNLLVNGTVNLAAVSSLRPDLVASGTSTLNTRIRGTFDNPEVEGRMAFQNASFSLREIPNGLDKVNGTILFDRTRANIESFSAESGGGNISVSGYVGFGAELSYQLAAQLNQVRVRYPEGISSQSNATLALTGSSRRSLLSGTVTVLRAGLTPQTDAGSMLGRSSRPIGIVPTGEFLRGLQFDIRVETAQSTEISTQLTKNIQADAELRLRGTPARPVLLGRASITQGEVQFFGTDYRINRGEVTFVNPVTIEPRVDLDLETRVRGIAVSINFSGPLNKLNMSYRSDPPLQSSEILALLAVGRTPTAATALGVGTINGQNLLGGGAGGGNAVLNSALSTPTNSNLQRFFGVTRLKIDPQLIGMDNTPQARMSLEQPISRDVTVTYVQMLSRAQGQMVRVQWDLSKEWSALATRDENGVLSVDFIFKRSFR